MKRKKTSWPARFGALLAILALAAQPGAANDSSATLSAGGLTFTRTSAIAMVSEDLYLSQDQVRVRYVFRNRTNAPVTLRIGFPLPDLRPDLNEAPVDIPDPSSPNFVRFQTRVDGRPIALAVDQHAILRGVDITARLRAARVPVSLLHPDFDRAVRALPAPVLAQWEREGLLEVDRVRPGGPPEYVRPMWTLRTAFHREQTFPVGRDVVVEHSYTPVVGASVQTSLLSPYIQRGDPEMVRMRRQYCVDAAFDRGAAALARRVGVERVQERRLSYILTTGANWAGPIGRFHLTVEKGSPNNLVSLCAPDIRRTGPTRFELTRTNFTPRENIEILFLVPAPE